MKKISRIFSILCLGLSTVSLAACGKSNSENNYTKGLEFTLSADGNSYSVSIGTATDTEIIIPSVYNKKPVTAIGNGAFDNCSLLESIVIPNSVKKIGGYAFENCSSLKNVKIPSSVTSIGKSIFFGCSSLTSLALPFIGDGNENNYSYNSNNYLGYLFGAASSSENSKYVPSSLKEVTILDDCTTIGYRAFYECILLESIVIPNSVTTIGSDAFKYCHFLESITIGKGVESIGRDAFENCTSLESIVIPSSVTTIGDRAFSGCSSLKSVVIGNGLRNIGNSAFARCSSLTTVYYKGTTQQWNDIYIGSSNGYLINANIIYNYKG